MPDFSCATPGIASNDLCEDLGGLLTVFWAPQNEIDWVTMADSANWDDSNYSVTSWAFTGSGGWNEIQFERKNGRLDSEFTIGNRYYEVIIQNLLLKGHSAARTVSMGQAVPCCGIVAQIHDNNGKARVVGKEFLNGVWVDPVQKLRITRHLDTHGVFGAEDDGARDEFDLSAEHSAPLPYSDVDIATMRA